MGSNKSIKIAVTSDQLAAEYQAGATIRELAEKYGCSFQNINIRVQNAGVVMRPIGGTRIHPDRLCPTCNVIFRPHAHDQVFCSLPCVRHKQTCIHGHALTEENRYHFPGSQSRCIICHRRRIKSSYERRKQRNA